MPDQRIITEDFPRELENFYVEYEKVGDQSWSASFRAYPSVLHPEGRLVRVFRPSNFDSVITAVDGFVGKNLPIVEALEFMLRVAEKYQPVDEAENERLKYSMAVLKDKIDIITPKIFPER